MEEWVAALPIQKLIVNRLPRGSDDDQMCEVVRLSEAEVDAICEHLLPELQEMLRSKVKELQSQEQSEQENKRLKTYSGPTAAEGGTTLDRDARNSQKHDRKTAHLATFEDIISEIKANLNQFVFEKQECGNPDATYYGLMKDIAIQECSQLLERHRDMPLEVYTDLETYSWNVREMFEYRTMALRMFDHVEFFSPMTAAEFRLREIYRLYLTTMTDVVLTKKGPPHQVACTAEALAKVKGLIVNDLEETNELMESPLVAACADGDAMAVKILLAAGANPNSLQYSDWTGFGYAAYQGQTDVLRVFREAGSNLDIDMFLQGDYTSLMYTVMEDNVDCVVELHALGADINTQNSSGMTALMFAAENGALKCTNKLLELGADVHVTDQSGRNALQYARQTQWHDSELEALLESRTAMEPHQQAEA